MSKPEPLSSNSFANSPVAQFALLTVQCCGLVLLCYWGWHVFAQMPFWDAFRRDAIHDGNPLLTPLYRVTVDVLAMLAGALMLKKSKWALVPYALHFAATLCLVLSITGYQLGMQVVFRFVAGNVASQIFVLALMLWLEAKKALSMWPLRGASKTAAH